MGLLWTTIHNHKAASSYPQHVTVQQAPTAEQARLLHDLELEAQARIVQTARLDNGLAKARVFVSRGGSVLDRVQVCFSLNGRDISFSYEPDELALVEPHDLYRRVLERLGQEIARELFRVSGSTLVELVSR